MQAPHVCGGRPCQIRNAPTQRCEGQVARGAEFALLHVRSAVIHDVVTIADEHA